MGDRRLNLKRKNILTDIRSINSYNIEEIGSLITTNYIKISRELSVRQAMRELIKNVGTQSLAVTIRVLMDEEMDGKETFHINVSGFESRKELIQL